MCDCFLLTVFYTVEALHRNQKQWKSKCTVPVDVSWDISKQLLRFFIEIDAFDCDSLNKFDGDEIDCGRDDCGVVVVTQSVSIAFEALRLKCSRKLSICTSIEFGVLAIAFVTIIKEKKMEKLKTLDSI